MFDERFFLHPRVPQNAMIRDPLHGLLRYDSCRVPFPLLSKGEQRTGRTFFVVVETFHREITSSPRPTNRPRPRPRWNPVVTVLSSEPRPAFFRAAINFSGIEKRSRTRIACLCNERKEAVGEENVVSPVLGS